MATTTALIHIDCPACGTPIELRGTADPQPTPDGEVSLTFDTAAVVLHAQDTHRPANAEPETSDPIQITEWLVIQRYRTDHGNWAWCMRCWGHDDCDGTLALDLSSRQYAESKAQRHRDMHHITPIAPEAEA